MRHNVEVLLKLRAYLSATLPNCGCASGIQKNVTTPTMMPTTASAEAYGGSRLGSQPGAARFGLLLLSNCRTAM